MNFQYFRLLLTTLLLACTCGPALFAQVFAPLGAQWTYFNFVTEGNGYLPVAYVYTVNKDTVVDGWDSRIIQLREVYADGRESEEGVRQEVVHTAGDSVYVYVKDSFRLIFDYSAGVGDTVRVVDEPFRGFFMPASNLIISDFAYRIDSVQLRLVGKDSLRVQYVSYLRDVDREIDQWGFQGIIDLYDSVPGQILESVGGLGHETMLGFTNAISYIMPFTPGRLTCYSDSLRDYHLLGVDCDSVLTEYRLRTSLPALAIDDAVGIYPNPFRGEVRFTASSVPLRRVEVRDVAGRVMYTREGSALDRLELGVLAPGVYFFVLTDGAGRQSVVRGVRE
ncbi:T9SS type A sorting domain-containing protein [Neolewinella sp.]|uniref:T9SS type A sorting domain-containing protein n=1 Tax=Neolewinella sp. TaxID=2993543 RepID=UPI003B524C28